MERTTRKDECKTQLELGWIYFYASPFEVSFVYCVSALLAPDSNEATHPGVSIACVSDAEGGSDRTTVTEFKETEQKRFSLCETPLGGPCPVTV